MQTLHRILGLLLTLAPLPACGGDDTPAVPAAPTGLVATPVEGGVRITWADNSDDEEQFKVMRLDEEIAPEYDVIGTVAVDVTAFDDLEIVSGEAYKYKVVARNDDGEAASEPVEFTAP